MEGRIRRRDEARGRIVFVCVRLGECCDGAQNRCRETRGKACIRGARGYARSVGYFGLGCARACGRRMSAQIFCQEFIEQFVQAGLSTEVPCPFAGADAYIPTSDAEFVSKATRDEPVIGLLHVCAADVARDGLADQVRALPCLFRGLH